MRNKKKSVNFRHHIGGGYYISVKSEYQRVDIRKFIRDYTVDSDADDDDNDNAVDMDQATNSSAVKATKAGVSLRIEEWADLWKLIDVVNGESTTLADAQPCYYGDDHMSQEDWLQCCECHPFDVGSMASLMK